VEEPRREMFLIKTTLIVSSLEKMEYGTAILVKCKGKYDPTLELEFSCPKNIVPQIDDELVVNVSRVSKEDSDPVVTATI
jgi:hypothetical protein